MNIEGAEYEILPKMFDDGSIDYINKFFMSWHWRKLSGFTEKRHNKIAKEAARRTKLVIWKFVEGEMENPF